MKKMPLLFSALLGLLACRGALAEDFLSRVKHGHADSGGVKIHYATLGEGPLVVMIHGFPDYWYTWRHQMAALAGTHQVVALDLRGYNRSDKPAGVASYKMPVLVSDVHAVIRHLKKEKAVIVGHDWGGAIAWNFAMTRPAACDKLIILNLPHPWGLGRELANNPDQQRNSQYARNFQKPGAHKKLSARGLSGWVKDKAAREKYRAAFERSDFEAMLNYYKANYPREPYKAPEGAPPRVKAPVLMFHGLEDRALLPGALNDTWKWLDKDLTLVTIPGSGHFVQQDAAKTVSKTMLSWLKLQRGVTSQP